MLQYEYMIIYLLMTSISLILIGTKIEAYKNRTRDSKGRFVSRPRDTVVPQGRLIPVNHLGRQVGVIKV